LTIVAIFLFAPSSIGQQHLSVPRIAYLSANPSGDFRSQAFRDGLFSFGYVEGKNIVIEYFLAPTTRELPELTARAVASRPNVIFAVNTPAALAAKKLTATIPIIFAGVAEPVATGLVSTLARPGGNVTGQSLMGADLAAKRLQMLQELVPGLARVAVLHNPANVAGNPSVVKTIEAGKKLGVEVRLVEALGTDDLDRLFSMLAADGIKAVVLVDEFTYTNNAEKIARLAFKYRLATMYSFRQVPDAGGLISYGPDLTEGYRRAAYYVHRVLTGTKPAELPVEQGMRFNLVINVKTLKALGLSLPPSILLQADDVIH
jgi:putative ABC transport system substrate-binding protein